MIDNLIPEFINIVKYQAAYGKPTNALQHATEQGLAQVKHIGPSKYELTFAHDETIDKIYLMDITGREILFTQELKQNSAILDFTALPEQMYIAVVNTDKNFYSIKLK